MKYINNIAEDGGAADKRLVGKWEEVSREKLRIQGFVWKRERRNSMGKLR